MLTQEEFGKHVGSQFSTSLGEREIDLTLVEVKGYLAGATEEKGMERFSVFFDGPPDFTLPQQSFTCTTIKWVNSTFFSSRSVAVKRDFSTRPFSIITEIALSDEGGKQ